MICERYHCTISEEACLKRQKDLTKHSGNFALLHGQGLGHACFKCEQGAQLKKGIKMGEPTEELKDGPETKTCSKCRKDKPLDQFGNDKKSPDGLAYWCKECIRDNAKKNYKKKNVDVAQPVPAQADEKNETPEKIEKLEIKAFLEIGGVRVGLCRDCLREYLRL